MTMPTPAHVHWDASWRTEAGRAAWSRPEQTVLDAARDVLASGGVCALDVGCGVGRHTVALAALGMRVSAVDMSQAGLDHVRAGLAGRGLTADLRQAPMTRLPFDDGAFDLVVAWNVVYHGTYVEVATAIEEITRVLRPGGRYLSTMLSTRNAEYGKGDQIDPGVFVQPDAPDDKVHPHLYADLAGLVRLHPKLAAISVVDQEQGRPGAYHWVLVFEKPVSN